MPPAREHLLTSVQLARFVAHGALRFDAVVPDSLNAQAVEVFDAGIPHSPYGTPLDAAFPEDSFARRLVELPTVAGALRSLVGPAPTVDHHFVHVGVQRLGLAGARPSRCTPTPSSTPGSTPSTSSSCTTRTT